MQKNKPTRIIIDTNLWISFVISNKLSTLDELLYNKNTQLLFNAELISEIEATKYIK